MQKIIRKSLPFYKRFLYILTFFCLNFIVILMIPNTILRIFCSVLTLSAVLASIPWILFPLYHLHIFFQEQRILTEQRLPCKDHDSKAINCFLDRSYEKACSIENTLSDRNIDYLSKQINTHFFYNTLDSIRGRAYCDGAYFVADMIETLSAFFRYSISRKGNIVSIQDELQNLNSYMKIQMFRFGDRIQYHVVTELKNLEQYQIPKLTLQPIVENSIIHGIEHYEKGGKIDVQIEETDSTVLIHVRDNGIGIKKEILDQINYNFENNYFESAELLKKHLNIALNNINNRICLLYGTKYHLHIFSTQNLGTEVQITLPKLPKTKRTHDYERTLTTN